MSESMFIHTTKHMEAQIKQLRDLGDDKAEGYMTVYRRMKRGHIKNLTQLKRELKKVNGNV